MTALSSGNVGIGTTEPSAVYSGDHTVLHVKGNNANAIGVVKAESFGSISLNKIEMYAADAGAGVGLYSQTASDMAFWTNDLQRVTIQSGGNVGIGTTAPDRPVEINSATGLGLRLTYDDPNGSAIYYVDYQVGSSGDGTITPSGGDLTINGRVHSSYVLNQDLTADSSWSGYAVYDTVGTEVFAGDFVFSPADGDYELADATDSTTVLCVGLVMAHADADKPTWILTKGYARLDSWDWTKFGTISDGLFLSETAGDATQKAPSTSGCYVQVLGRVITPDIIEFKPSTEWTVHQ